MSAASGGVGLACARYAMELLQVGGELKMDQGVLYLKLI